MFARSPAPSPAPRMLSRVVAPLAALIGIGLAPSIAWASETAHAGPLPPVWMAGFFVAMLLSIAIIPLTKLEHWWHSNFNKLLLGMALAAYPVMWLLTNDHFETMQHTLHEYASFIILLGTLFYIAGGIYVAGDLRATPRTNTIFLAIGTVFASFVGTTGASMLLIRPVLRTNAERKNKVHVVVFFIFLVSNVGGSLLPLGDPPLFLGYLQGVPFLWTLSLWPQMGMVAAILLVAFYLMDSHFYKKEPPPARRADDAHVEPLRIDGKLNFLWLGGIIASVGLIRDEHGIFLREAAMIACAAGSYFTSPKSTRKLNEFTWFPIVEVAALFIGIFLTMIPALMILKAQGGQLGVDSPARFFWASGSLSSFLDNAPTYLVFFNTAKGMVAQGLLDGAMVDPVGVPVVTLTAISCGSVFMGANTYIGNGPNFMVKAIAEEARVVMPSFFGYMKWSGLILIPCFVLVTLVFFM